MQIAPDTAKDTLNRPVVAAMFLGIVLVMLTAIAFPGGRFVLVILAPGSSQQALLGVISRAGGTFVDSTRFDWMGVAYSDDTQFTRRLTSAGALMVVNHLLVAGCKGRSQS